jgi:hypothetical protein
VGEIADRLNDIVVHLRNLPRLSSHAKRRTLQHFSPVLNKNIHGLGSVACTHRARTAARKPALSTLTTQLAACGTRLCFVGDRLTGKINASRN